MFFSVFSVFSVMRKNTVYLILLVCKKTNAPLFAGEFRLRWRFVFLTLMIKIAFIELIFSQQLV